MPWSQPLRRRLAATKRALNGLGSLEQYPPKPLRLPARYLDTRPLGEAVSIVTPSLNGAEFLEDAIRSVTSQRYPRLEYIVQDGGSTDETCEILQRHSAALTSWESVKDSGQSQALNRGFARTSAELMAYLNADDILLPGSLAYVADFMRRNPDVDVVYGHRVLIDADGLDIGRHVLPRHSNRILSWADFIPQETLFWRRRTWEEAGGQFDETFQMALDWDLVIRLRDAGARFVRLPRFLGAFRVHGDQKTLTQGPTLGVEEMDRIRKRANGRDVPRQEVRWRVRPYLMRHVAVDRLYRAGGLRY